jgi:hypothetical protein
LEVDEASKKTKRSLEVNWVYKTKLKENGDVDKYKAQLVTKNYKQVYGVNYKILFHGYKA